MTSIIILKLDYVSFYCIAKSDRKLNIFVGPKSCFLFLNSQLVTRIHGSSVQKLPLDIMSIKHIVGPFNLLDCRLI